MVDVLLVGNVEPQFSAVHEALIAADVPVGTVPQGDLLTDCAAMTRPDLIIVAGWRHLISPEVLAIPRLGVIGFHSAKLPDFPGRAPVAWTLLRGGPVWNTMFYLDEGVDSGDIIDAECRPLEPDDTPESIYRWIAESDVRMLRRHLPGILVGIAPRIKQDPALRGPLTTKDGWRKLAELTRYTPA